MDIRVRRAVAQLTKRLEIIEKRLKPLLREKAELEPMVASLSGSKPFAKKKQDGNHDEVNPATQRGKWAAGMDLAAAAQAYIGLCEDEGWVPMQRLLEALERGGAALGELENRRQAILSTTISNNADPEQADRLFDYDKGKKLVKLRPPEKRMRVTERKRRSRRAAKKRRKRRIATLGERSGSPVGRDQSAAAAIDAPRI